MAMRCPKGNYLDKLEEVGLYVISPKIYNISTLEYRRLTGENKIMAGIIIPK
jgi:hypothetical protein